MRRPNDSRSRLASHDRMFCFGHVDGAAIAYGKADQAQSWQDNCSVLSMKQQTFAMAADQNAEFERYRRPTWRDQFLATMEPVAPWDALCAVIEPYYPRQATDVHL
jgi:hypothetical protein